MKVVEKACPFPLEPHRYDGYPGLPNQNSFNIVKRESEHAFS